MTEAGPLVMPDGDAIRALRSKAMLTQQQVATKARLERVTVVHAEQGRLVKARTLIRLAKALGVKPVELRASDTEIRDKWSELSPEDKHRRWLEHRKKEPQCVNPAHVDPNCRAATEAHQQRATPRSLSSTSEDSVKTPVQQLEHERVGTRAIDRSILAIYGACKKGDATIQQLEEQTGLTHDDILNAVRALDNARMLIRSKSADGADAYNCLHDAPKRMGLVAA